MIVFITTPEHSYTHEPVARVQSPGLRVNLCSYPMLFSRKVHAKATYVFTDMDRLSIRDLSRAARLFRTLKDSGSRVLNDPARWLDRAALLRRLHTLGLNQFCAYRVEENPQPARWPVFLRTEGDHGYPVGDLIHSQTELDAAIESAITAGSPVSALIVVEYAAEPVRSGLFRKLAAFRIGSYGVAHTCVHEDKWVVKYGKEGVAPPELYEEEFRIVTTNPFWPRLEKVFETAGIEYGRVDFGLVNGQVQVYEINTNPQVKFLTEHPSAWRKRSYGAFKENYIRALTNLSLVPSSLAVIDPVSRIPNGIRRR
ncbi:MAG TPA: hypothetical protein VFS47_03605 [Steroidobacteraceae bacterium]|nr:hypothetical protein [Steroidobacteraceae bacterium]